MKKIISIVVVNWNSGLLTLKAIHPFLNNVSEKFECQILIVDNCSSDNSIQLLQHNSIHLITNFTNRGFGTACNQALKIAKGDYVLLLNPDTQSKIEVLEQLFDFLEMYPEYAVTGPRQISENGLVSRCCGRFPKFKTSLYEVLSLSKIWPRHFSPVPVMREWNHLQSRDVDHIMGSYMLIRKSAIDKVGFMDDDYFVYYEDIDFSKRLFNAGYKSHYLYECAILHQGGGSGEAVSAKRLYYSLSARNIYWHKHLVKWNAAILTILSFTIEPVLRTVLIVMKGRFAQIPIIFKSYIWYFKKVVE